MRHNPTSLLLLAALVVGPALASCDNTKPMTATPGEARGYTIKPAVYGEAAKIDPKVREKCSFDARLTAEVTKAIQEKGTGTRTGEGKSLQLKIVHLSGAEPEWEGEIRVQVEGLLHFPDGDEIHEFRAHGHSVGGIGGGVPGICKGLHEIADEVADHVVEWMASPRHEAEIGDHAI